MKNVYLIEAYETCRVWKQYSVEAYTIEQAKEMILRGDIYDQVQQLDHDIDTDISVDEIRNIKHIGTRGEL